MEFASAETHLPDDWRAAIAEAGKRRRILVLGATDMGKTSFIKALAASVAEPMRLIDLDPGQKMLGPPGTASLGTMDRLERFIFVGSTSASNLGGIGRAAAALATDAAQAGAFVVNTAGFVKGLGARLQAITAKAITPDLIVEIGVGPAAEAVVPAPQGVPLIRLQRSPLARRKSAAARAAIRQQAFASALSGAAVLRLAAGFHPASPAFPPDAARPVCALADAEGEDMCLGVLTGIDGDEAVVEAPPPPRPVAAVRLGKMWAAPDGQGSWQLIDKLSRSWTVPA